MNTVLFIIDNIEVDEWMHTVIASLAKKSMVYIYRENIQSSYKDNFLIKTIRRVSDKRYKILPKAKNKKSLDNLHNLQFIDNYIDLNIDTVINFSENKIKLSKKIKMIITVKDILSKNINTSSFGLIELQNQDNIIFSSIEIQKNNKIENINIVSAFDILAFERSISQHLFKLSSHLIRIKTIDKNINITNSIFREYTKIKFFNIFFIYLKTFIYRAIINIFRKKNKKWGIRFIENNTSIKNSIRLIPPNNYFWADPFIIKSDSGYDIFMEEKKVGKGNGFISYLNINKDGIIKSHEVIIKENYHLSYPFIFKYNNIFYMIPESEMNQTIDLYECKDYPLKWSYSKNIMQDISAVDTTLFEYNNIWWMFTNIKSIDGMSIQDELFLFYADSPLSNDWSAHPQNPVISDIRCSRPAGKIFIDEKNRIIRPSQNSLKRYGYSVKLNQIIILNKFEYKEKTVDVLEPWNNNIEALHTYNKCDKAIIIDCIE